MRRMRGPCGGAKAYGRRTDAVLDRSALMYKFGQPHVKMNAESYMAHVESMTSNGQWGGSPSGARPSGWGTDAKAAVTL